MTQSNCDFNLEAIQCQQALHKAFLSIISSSDYLICLSNIYIRSLNVFALSWTHSLQSQSSVLIKSTEKFWGSYAAASSWRRLIQSPSQPLKQQQAASNREISLETAPTPVRKKNWARKKHTGPIRYIKPTSTWRIRTNPNTLPTPGCVCF